MFVLDGSGSVNAGGSQNFDRIKTWVKSVASKFDINGSIQVGVVQYSHYQPNVQVPFDLYHSVHRKNLKVSKNKGTFIIK